MGGLALDELGYFSDKLVYVELRPNSEFVTISGISSVMKSHPNLQSLSHPVACLLAVYTLSGADYVSSFFGVSHHGAVKRFLNNISFICSDQELVLFEMRKDGYFEFCSLSLPACIKFIMCLY